MKHLGCSMYQHLIDNAQDLLVIYSPIKGHTFYVLPTQLAEYFRHRWHISLGQLVPSLLSHPRTI